MSDKLRKALELAREYVLSAANRFYDGTNGHGIRKEAARRLSLIDEALAADDAARGTMREEFEAWAVREGWPTDYTPDAECGIEGGPVYRDPRTHAAWWAYREGQAAARAAAPQSAEPAPTDAQWVEEAMRLHEFVKHYLQQSERHKSGSEHYLACLDQVSIGTETLRAHLSTRPQQVAPTEADRLDAQRYRWLRDTSVPPHNFYLSVPIEFDGVRYTPAEVDAAIDAAMSAQAGGKEQGS